MINPLVEEIMQAFPGLSYVQQPKKTRTMEHYFYDMVMDCHYITYTNGYVRRVVTAQSFPWNPPGRKLMYPINGRKTTKVIKRNKFHGEQRNRYEREYVMVNTETKRLELLRRHVEQYRKKSGK
jgi:hypothetical protein